MVSQKCAGGFYWANLCFCVAVFGAFSLYMRDVLWLGYRCIDCYWPSGHDVGEYPWSQDEIFEGRPLIGCRSLILVLAPPASECLPDLRYRISRVLEGIRNSCVQGFVRLARPRCDVNYFVTTVVWIVCTEFCRDLLSFEVVYSGWAYLLVPDIGRVKYCCLCYNLTYSSASVSCLSVYMYVISYWRVAKLCNREIGVLVVNLLSHWYFVTVVH